MRSATVCLCIKPHQAIYVVCFVQLRIMHSLEVMLYHNITKRKPDNIRTMFVVGLQTFFHCHKWVIGQPYNPKTQP